VLLIGLTGGIGSGKSTVAAMLGRLGAAVVDSDAIAREVMEVGSPGLAAVVDEFGPQVLAEDGRLDRPALARLVFSADDRRRSLEAITHPLIAARTRERFEATGPDKVLVHDVPLLVEGALGPTYHLVVVVSARPAVRVDRLVARRGMTVEQVRSRMAAQASDGQRRSAADVWIDNDRSRSAVLGDVESLWRHRLLPFESNLRSGVPAALPAPGWRAQQPSGSAVAARLADRVRRAAGRLGRGVEHVGSTAVPGLVGRGVIDLQLGVASVADADAVSAALGRAGFPVVPGITADRVHPGVDPDPAGWAKRLHRGADPESAAEVHVRVLDGPAWRTAVLLRDWLRGVPAERARYDAFRRERAAGSVTDAQLESVLEDWAADAVRRAARWRPDGPPG
jgi:dephospho-CoA kinase